MFSIIYKQSTESLKPCLLFCIWFNTHFLVVQKNPERVTQWFSCFVCEVILTRLVLRQQMRGQPTKPPCDIIQFVHGNHKKTNYTPTHWIEANCCLHQTTFSKKQYVFFYDRYRLSRLDKVWPLYLLFCLFVRLLSPASTSHSWCHTGHWYTPQDCHNTCARVHSALSTPTPPTSLLCENIETNSTYNRRDTFCGRFKAECCFVNICWLLFYYY